MIAYGYYAESFIFSLWVWLVLAFSLTSLSFNVWTNNSVTVHYAVY